VNAQPPYAPVLVTTLGTGYTHGQIFSSQYGRGIGDCMSKDTWTWDGRQFVHTSSMTTGMCKLVAPDSTWELPTRVFHVKHHQPSRTKES
jgi:lipid-binding SYLF domain-containing protein